MHISFTPEKNSDAFSDSHSGWSKRPRQLSLPSTVNWTNQVTQRQKCKAVATSQAPPHEHKQVQTSTRSHRAQMMMRCLRFGLAKDSAIVLHCCWFSSSRITPIKHAHLKYFYFLATLYFDHGKCFFSPSLKTCWERDHYPERGKGSYEASSSFQ